jgi:opacity protein-like surface antigen
MKRITVLAAILFLIPATVSYAITGLGFGIRGGMVAGLQNDNLDSFIKAIDSTSALSKNMTMIGGHLKIGTLPVIDFELALEYAWKKKEITPGVDFTISDLGVIGSAKYHLDFPLIKPYVGAGLGLHRLAYKLQGYGGTLILPGNESKTGYHGLAGVKIHPPLSPVEFFAEGRYTYISTENKSTKYSAIYAGGTFNLP